MLKRNFTLFKELCQLGKHMRLLSLQERTYEEVKIPVPWGHVSGKWWGPYKERPILGIHGWQDNCGTFDTLAPYLPSQIGFLAIDLPGHGWSSNLPPGVFYHNIDYVTLVQRIVQYFHWSKVSFLGHSMGGIISYTYSVLYPAAVDFLICLDAFKPIVFDLNNIDTVAVNLVDFIKYDTLNSAKTEPPNYTFQELEQILHIATGKSVSLKSCRYLLRRNIAPSTINLEKLYLTRDPRLKIPTFTLGSPNEVVLESAYKLKCPIFISKSSLRPSFFESVLHADDVLEILEKNNSNFEFHNIEGTHHVHLNNPERLVDLINNFIERHDVEDRSRGNS